jgi:hypothetical protein
MVPATGQPFINGSAECGVMSTPAPPNWLLAVRCYLAASFAGHIVWEVAQMPLYTLWRTGSRAEIAWSILHCTMGDVLIASTALMGTLAVLGSPAWPYRHAWRVGAGVIAIGLGYTVFSERVNLARGAWAYADLMPTLPCLGTGLAPLAQWLTIPALCLALAYHVSRLWHHAATDVEYAHGLTHRARRP